MQTVRIRASLLAAALVVNLFVAGFLNAPGAYACSCIFQPLEKEIRTSDAVFSGEVVNIDESDLSPGVGPRLGKVTFDVNESWKGMLGESVAVYGQGPEESCGIEFENDESYLVYAYRSNGDTSEPLETNFCDATKLLDEAGGDLQILGPPTTGLPDTGGPAPLSRGASSSIAVAVLIALSGTLALRRWVRRSS
jgi:hypothetical protein